MVPTTDPTTSHDHRGHLAGPAPVLTWVGLLLAPAVFAVHLQGAYLLVLADCGQSGGAWLVHGAGIVATLVAAAGTFAAWLAWSRAGAGSPGEEGTPMARTRLLAIAGGGLSSVLTLILLAQTIAGFFTPRCQ